MNGVGGLVAVSASPQAPSPVVSDIRGNGYALYSVSQGGLVWYSSRVTGYGAVPGYRPLPLGDGAGLGPASAWRGKWADITQLNWLGARYYDPMSGRFLGPDPLGHASDPSLYTFCNGDPIGRFDPDGKCAEPNASSDPMGLQIDPRRADQTFRAMQNGLFDVEATVDGVWDFAVALVGTPQYGTGQGTVEALGNPLARLGLYPQTPSTVQTQNAAGTEGQLGQNVINTLGMNVGQEAVDTTISEPTAPESVNTPNASMRGYANLSGTYVDPLSGNTEPANGTLSADHIIPQSWIVKQPGFDMLTPDQQSWILNNPINTQGLPQTFNSSKGAQMPGSWTTYQGLPLNQAYVENNAQQVLQLKTWIWSQIDAFNQGNSSKK
jgi:RHS repeat-associated protein